MKKRLTVNIDSALISAAKRYAQARGVSLSSLVEGLLREITGREKPSFSSRWRGKFVAAKRENDVRYAALEKKYLQ